MRAVAPPSRSGFGKGATRRGGSRRANPRGSVYVAVLGVAMLVTILGLSALAALRIQRNAANGAKEVATARLYAESAVDVVLYRLANDANWRTTYLNDTWTANERIVKESFRYKLVDDDGNLADDDTDPVRLYTRSTVEEATRICSVRLEADPLAVASANRLANPGAERGLTDWTGAGATTLVRDNTNPHRGGACIKATNRAGVWAGPGQYITSTATNGVTYYIEAWVRMESGTDTARIAIDFDSTVGGTQSVFADTAGVGTAWTLVTAVLTPAWSGTLNWALLKFETTTGALVFYVDDALLIEGNAPPPPPPLQPLRGTWRREVE